MVEVTLRDVRRLRMVSLLPGFDEYLLGYGDRTAAVAPEHSEAIVPGGNGVFRPTIVVDGEVVGTWGRRVKGGEIVIEPVLFGRLSARDREGLDEAALAYGAFIGHPAQIAGPGQTRSRNSSTRRVSRAVASASYDGSELSAK